MYERHALACRPGLDLRDVAAHHLFPHVLREKFQFVGIDVNRPEFGVWAARRAHENLRHADLITAVDEKLDSVRVQFADLDWRLARDEMLQYLDQVLKPEHRPDGLYPIGWDYPG